MTIRRLKTYAGTQGFVYQYYFVGQRPGEKDSSTEYIFDVTSDRKRTYSVTIRVPRALLDSWSRTHLRSLSDAEQYAAVKMRLFRAFDEIEAPQVGGLNLLMEEPFFQESLASLGVD